VRVALQGKASLVLQPLLLALGLGLAAIADAQAPAADASVQARCVVTRGQKSAKDETGRATMQVRNDGAPCSINHHFDGSPASSVRISQQAANGSVTISGLRVNYTPRAGFTGEDAFVVTWYGRGLGNQATSRNARVRVLVTVRN
jgi:hypothetical protein